MRMREWTLSTAALVYLASTFVGGCGGAQSPSYETAMSPQSAPSGGVVATTDVEYDTAEDMAEVAGAEEVEAPPEMEMSIDEPSPAPAQEMAPTEATSSSSRHTRASERRAERRFRRTTSPPPAPPASPARPTVTAANQPGQPTAQQAQAQGTEESLPRVNDFREASEDNLATFSLDVDTASYTMARSRIRAGVLPPPQSVRVEEFINFFDYNQSPPRTTDGTPFAVHLESAPSPFGDTGNRRLLRVGVQGIEVPQDQRPAANLVFLVDVSGSMQDSNKLPLVQFALTTLVNTLRPDDTIGIVVYAGHEAVLLEPTSVANRGVLLSTIENLSAGGSTNGEGGIRAAYDLAQQHFRQGGINRVVLCTDGDFNVGLTGNALIRLIERYRRRQITLTVLGFGHDANDRDMEQLADRGNGSYAFVDSRNEALRVLGRNLQGTIQVIAADVKVQVVFNPEVVARFRLIGYENRVLAHRDFENDAVDAAEIGSGQFVTAYLEYELRPGVQVPQDARNLVTVRLRYKRPGEDQSIERRFTMPVRNVRASFESASPVFRFGAAVAEFAEILRRSEHSVGSRFNDVVRIAQSSTWSQSSDTQEFIDLVRSAQQLWR